MFAFIGMFAILFIAFIILGFLITTFGFKGLFKFICYAFVAFWVIIAIGCAIIQYNRNQADAKITFDYKTTKSVDDYSSFKTIP